MPAAFITWGLFFAAGADNAGLVKVLGASVIGSVGGLVVRAVAPQVADLPDFWWIATGLDNWAPAGGGVGNSLAALGKRETAGAGAFGGVLWA